MGKIEKKFSLMENIEESHKFTCKECSKETSHKIIATYTELGTEDCGGGHSVDWTEKNQIIQCLGCETVSFRVASTFSEDWDFDRDGNAYYNETVKYYPARSEGLKAINSYLLPENVQRIYEETVLAIENEQNILAGIGIRALVETICKDLNAEGDSLFQKIESLGAKSIITNEGISTLHKFRALGNNAAHEVKKHNKQQLSLAIQIIEHMLDGTYIIPHRVSEVFK